MSAISSLSSISNLNLWLDATDLTSMVFDPIYLSQFSTITPTLLQWNDKSSNAYQFVPIRPDDRPKMSTNAVLFDQVSSFQLVSKQKIAATSSLDFFAVLTPYSLWGPRQPIFDSADITLCETDTRFNVQVYADGNEFFRGVRTQNCNNAAAIYKGDLYIGTYSATSAAPSGKNYLQKYDRITRSFDYIPVLMQNTFTHALTVFDGKLYSAGGAMVNFNTGGRSGQGFGPAEYWNGTSSIFLSTSFISTFPGALTVHKRRLFTFTTSGWAGLYINDNLTSTLASQNKPQMYELNPLTNNFRWIADTNVTYITTNNNGADYTVFTSNAISFRGDLYIGAGCNNSHGRSMTRYTNQDTHVPTNLNTSIYGYLSIFMGSLIIPHTGDARIYNWNENVLEAMGRWNPLAANSQTWIASGGMTTYKGKLHGIFSGSNNTVFSGGSNWIQVFSGDRGSTYSNSVSAFLTTNVTGVTNCNLMIVHDGKLFVQNGFNTTNSVIEYGNGISMDEPFSTIVGAPILVHVRKSQNATQLYLNGTLVESQRVSFSYSNQPAREMWVGGAAGLLQSGLSDSGSDHMQGAIHAIAQYSSNLNVSDRQKAEGILAWSFGIQNVLPASHPYRNSSP